MFPMSRGGEPGWSIFVPVAGEAPSAPNTGGMLTLAPYLFGGTAVDYATMTPAQVLTARSSAFAREYEATNPDLRRFFRSGGRLILWHGEEDPGPSPVGSNDYAAAVERAAPAASTRFRHFLLPGVHHCGGGPGASPVDWLTTLDQWVGSGTAPETVVGKRTDGPLTRKHCAWPKVAHYSGSGDANNPDSWSCVSAT
jgi:feruloyl esterase